MQTLAELILRSQKVCPETRLAVAGYSQGTQIVRGAVDRLLPANATAKISSVVLMADPQYLLPVKGIEDQDKVIELCNRNDAVCSDRFKTAQSPHVAGVAHLMYGHFGPLASAHVLERAGLKEWSERNLQDSESQLASAEVLESPDMDATVERLSDLGQDGMFKKRDLEVAAGRLRGLETLGMGSVVERFRKPFIIPPKVFDNNETPETPGPAATVAALAWKNRTRPAPQPPRVLDEEGLPPAGDGTVRKAPNLLLPGASGDADLASAGPGKVKVSRPLPLIHGLSPLDDSDLSTTGAENNASNIDGQGISAEATTLDWAVGQVLHHEDRKLEKRPDDVVTESIEDLVVGDSPSSEVLEPKPSERKNGLLYSLEHAATKAAVWAVKGTKVVMHCLDPIGEAGINLFAKMIRMTGYRLKWKIGTVPTIGRY
jgi:hypothetical protein